MIPPLRAIERRALAVLIEKSLTQPATYPMSLNAIVAGCNQKSNRDPLLNLDEDAVYDALETLRQRGLVSRLLAGMGSRVDRYKHETKACFGWEKPQRAVMAELLLRGPQTGAELRSRAGRMHPFESPEALTSVLDMLSAGDHPMVAALPRAPGQSAVRYTHLLYPDDEQPETAAPAPAEPEPPAAPDDPYQRQLSRLATEIGDLRNALTDMRRRLEAVEGQSGLARPDDGV